MVSVRRDTSTIFALKISAKCMISARLSTDAWTRNSAISLEIVWSGSMSRILRTLTSLWSCLVTWSMGWTAPSRVSVIRETSGSSVGPTASVSMLNPRRLNRPAIRARTPGLFSTSSDRTCFRPVSARERLEVLELDQLRSSGFHLAASERQPTMSRAAAPAGIIG